MEKEKNVIPVVDRGYFEEKVAQLEEKLSSRLKQEIEATLSRIEQKQEEPEEKKIEQKQFEGIMAIRIADIPLGEALVGGGLALIVSELVDAFFAPIKAKIEEKVGWGEAIVKLGTAYAVKRFRIMGRAGDIAVLFLAYDVVRSVVPLEEWIKGIFKRGEGGEKKEESSSSSHSSYSSGNGNKSLSTIDKMRLALR